MITSIKGIEHLNDSRKLMQIVTDGLGVLIIDNEIEGVILTKMNEYLADKKTI